MKNFHLPLPEQTYAHLRAEAERMQVPATTLAREALDSWLRQHRGLRGGNGGNATRSRLRFGISRDRAPYENRQGSKMKRGDVYWAHLLPRSGSEQTGRRPVIVVSHDGFNQALGWRSIIVVPLSTSSSQGKRGPTVIELSGGTAGLPKASFAVCHQVTTLDRAKLTKRAGSLPSVSLREVEEGLKAAMDLD